MIKFTQRIKVREDYDYTLTLPFDQRIKGRLKVRLDSGEEAGVILDRGPILRDGDCIATDDGKVARVQAANETVSTVSSDNLLLLSRICYHLGNRHTPLQITEGMARYQHDHVLDDMVRGLGLEPICEQAPFEPEPGAYGEHNSDHAHGHSHGGHSHGGHSHSGHSHSGHSHAHG